jgi:ABC-type sugar transport system ATPase subunit
VTQAVAADVGSPPGGDAVIATRDLTLRRGAVTALTSRNHQMRNAAEEQLTAVGLRGAVEDRLKDPPAPDPNATESAEALIRTLVPKLTVVIMTHNLAQAVRITDRRIFLNQGRMVGHGDAQQVFEHPEHEETGNCAGGRSG